MRVRGAAVLANDLKTTRIIHQEYLTSSKVLGLAGAARARQLRQRLRGLRQDGHAVSTACYSRLLEAARRVRDQTFERALGDAAAGGVRMDRHALAACVRRYAAQEQPHLALKYYAAMLRRRDHITSDVASAVFHAVGQVAGFEAAYAALQTLPPGSVTSWHYGALAASCATVSSAVRVLEMQRLRGIPFCTASVAGVLKVCRKQRDAATAMHLLPAVLQEAAQLAIPPLADAREASRQALRARSAALAKLRELRSCALRILETCILAGAHLRKAYRALCEEPHFHTAPLHLAVLRHTVADPASPLSPNDVLAAAGSADRASPAPCLNAVHVALCHLLVAQGLLEEAEAAYARLGDVTAAERCAVLGDIRKARAAERARAAARRAAQGVAVKAEEGLGGLSW